MFRENWRDPGFWRWWFRSGAPRAVRTSAGILLLVALVGGGVFAADKLSQTTAATGTEAYTVETTVRKVVTVQRQGKVIRKLVPVVKRVLIPAIRYKTQTEFGTELVTVPGKERVVRQSVLRYVPRIRDRLVTVAGKTRTVSETRLIPTTTIRTQTQTSVVTAERTVTNTQTQTRTLVDQRTVTNTETQLRTITDTKTLTQATPPVTITNTQTLPAQTVTVMVTVTLPKPR